jgi:predicted dienelactone hydrolase
VSRNCAPQDDAPVLPLSPGFRGTRLYYNFLVSAIASEGFTVITIDHPGETNSITYPNSTAVYVDLPNPTNIDDLTPYAYIRAADASSIIDQSSNVTAMAKLSPRKASTDRVIVAGHSIGSAAAVIAASQDPSILCTMVSTPDSSQLSNRAPCPENACMQREPYASSLLL